ncbi:MAG: hypothetical protein DIU52_006990 [bacterium]|jgi:predicted hydrocarbon binding protein
MSPSPSGASTAPADLTLVPRPEATIAPAVPLALLESVRAHDRPSEVLEDEDLTVSMPRRLGLTDVIDSQIRRYRANGRRAVPLTEVADLFRLVLRRPDAEAILRAAGTMIGRELFSTGAPGALRLLPRTARNALLRRALRRRMLRLTGAEALSVRGQPIEVHITGGLPAALEHRGIACVLYDRVIEELASLYTGQPLDVQHHECQGRGAEACVWILAG